MELVATKPDDSGRKRRKKEVPERNFEGFVGRYVKKLFPKYGEFLGKVVSFSDEWYKVTYEDEDSEELDKEEVAEIILLDCDFDAELTMKKNKLDRLLGMKSGTNKRKAVTFSENVNGKKRSSSKKPKLSAGKKTRIESEKKKTDMVEPVFSVATRPSSSSKVTIASDKMKFAVVEPEVPLATGLSYIESDPEGAEKKYALGDDITAPLVDNYLSCDGEIGDQTVQKLSGEGDGYTSDSSEDSQVGESNSYMEIVPLIPAPELPPSSNNIGVPDDLVSHLLSVYTFLRSFSVDLFLSPFLLDDFVGSINCSIRNNLIDDIHLALMRPLKRYLEFFPPMTNGALRASKCLRRLDWSLLDILTWPVYLVEYLLVMGYTDGTELKGFHKNILDSEYYSLSAAKKLTILQILCDDLTQTVLRSEVDARAIYEEGSMSDETSMTLVYENGPRKVHPKSSKTSACTDRNSTEFVSEPPSSSTLGKNAAADIDVDSNSDDCRLCGMDGMLVCCDGCPSAYHPRCICLSRLPEGKWLCPECNITEAQLSLQIGKGLRGAEIFGIDPYEQVYLGICNHLLVLKSSNITGPFSKYYDKKDVIKVLQLLSSSQYTDLYADIRKKILQYWQIVEEVSFCVPSSVKTDSATILEDTKEAKNLLDSTGVENIANNNTESNVEKVVQLCQTVDNLEVGLICNATLGTVDQVSVPVSPKDIGSLFGTKSPDLLKTEFEVSTLPVSIHLNNSVLISQGLCCSPHNQKIISPNGKVAEHAPLLASGNAIIIYREVEEGKPDENGKSSYTGSLFKPHGYANQYIHGDFAKSAAATVEIDGSDGVSETQTSSKTKKYVSDHIAAQVKAFSAVCIRFSWPISGKKFVEAPRERCNWCYQCKAPPSSRRGCLFNSAALSAVRRAGKNPPIAVKDLVGSFQAIGLYILYMEDILGRLVVGPFLSSIYRKRWREEVDNASTCGALKHLLLQLEEHIRLIAFSGEWLKLVDEWSFDILVASNGASTAGSSSKRSNSKRTKKQSVKAEIVADTGDADLKIVKWWRGGDISKLVFHKGVLPRSIVRKGARQGGKKKFAGIYYSEGPEIPNRTRRFCWRAAVEMCKNVQQLALQVRYLDANIRWSDLVRPDQSSHAPKITDTETSCFRNAVIRDKINFDSKIRYELFFGDQKHLPSRILKNRIGVEEINGEDRFWLWETHIPLYLIKEYEDKVNTAPLSSVASPEALSEIQKLQRKAWRKDIFMYLQLKQEMGTRLSCAACQEFVKLRDAVKCSSCAGFCHTECTTGVLGSNLTCNECHAKTLALEEQKKALVLKEQREALAKQEQEKAKAILEQRRHNALKVAQYKEQQRLKAEMKAEAMKEQQRLKAEKKEEAIKKQQRANVLRAQQNAKGREDQRNSDAWNGHQKVNVFRNQNKAFVFKDQRRPQYSVAVRHSDHQQTLVYTGKSEASAAVLTMNNPSEISAFGIQWKNLNHEDNGLAFQFYNILYKGKTGVDPSMRPSCKLCNRLYNPDLMYICCEICQSWYHADAVDLQEFQVSNVVGFKCLGCQKIPFTCPYQFSEPKPSVVHQENVEPVTSQPEVVWGDVGSGLSSNRPQKQQIRRQIKHEKEVGGPSIASNIEPEIVLEANAPPSQLADWSNSAADEGLSFEEYPQTYFSLGELLADDNDINNYQFDETMQLDPFGAHIHLEPFDAGAQLASSDADASIQHVPVDDNMQLDPFADIPLVPFEESIDMSDIWDPSFDLVENLVSEIPNDQAVTVTAEPNEVPCGQCGRTRPVPERCCELCGFQMHGQCSPWIEDFKEDRWICGNCRN